MRREWIDAVVCASNEGSKDTIQKKLRKKISKHVSSHSHQDAVKSFKDKEREVIESSILASEKKSELLTEKMYTQYVLCGIQ